MRAKRIVGGLLRFSRRPRDAEKGPVELVRVLDEALFLVGPQLKDGKLEIVRSYAPATAHGNANQLQQIALNLLVNAIQAVGPAGPGPGGSRPRASGGGEPRGRRGAQEGCR